MRHQKGHVFRKGKSWFVRFYDDLLQPDGTIERTQVCKKVIECDGEFRSKSSVKSLVAELLANSINSGRSDPRSTMRVSDFVEQVHLPAIERDVRPATMYQYRTCWRVYLRPRVVALDVMLRDFRTAHAQEILSSIASETRACRSSLRHAKVFLSATFKEAKRLGYYDGANPVEGSKVPKREEPDRRYAYSPAEIGAILSALQEPARTVALTAACTGLRKSELLGLIWSNFDGQELRVTRSIWNGIFGGTKTHSSKAAIAVMPQLAGALENLRTRLGKLAQPETPIFQNGRGGPLSLDNLVAREIRPALDLCKACGKRKDEHKPEAHLFERDSSIPAWHGWHAFRRGLATNLHELAIPDKDIQGILRHSDIRLTQNTYILNRPKNQAEAMDALSAKLESHGVCNDYATPLGERVN